MGRSRFSTLNTYQPSPRISTHILIPITVVLLAHYRRTAAYINYILYVSIPTIVSTWEYYGVFRLISTV